MELWPFSSFPPQRQQPLLRSSAEIIFLLSESKSDKDWNAQWSGEGGWVDHWGLIHLLPSNPAAPCNNFRSLHGKADPAFIFGPAESNSKSLRPIRQSMSNYSTRLGDYAYSIRTYIGLWTILHVLGNTQGSKGSTAYFDHLPSCAEKKDYSPLILLVGIEWEIIC